MDTARRFLERAFFCLGKKRQIWVHFLCSSVFRRVSDGLQRKACVFWDMCKVGGFWDWLSDNTARASDPDAPGHHIIGSFLLPCARSNSCTHLELKLASLQAFVYKVDLIALIATLPQYEHLIHVSRRKRFPIPTRSVDPLDQERQPSLD